MHDATAEDDLEEAILMRPSWKRWPASLKWPHCFRDGRREQDYMANQFKRSQGLLFVVSFTVFLVINILCGLAEGFSELVKISHSGPHQLRYSIWMLPWCICEGVRWAHKIWRTDITMLPIPIACFSVSILTHRGRVSTLLSQDPSLAWADVGHLAYEGDGPTVALLGFVMAGVFTTGAFRSRWSLPLSLFFPLAYAGLTFPMPSNILAGNLQLRFQVVCAIAAQAILGFFGAAYNEKRERRDFLRTQLLQKSLIQEKVLRFAAEHESERGPMSSRNLEISIGSPSEAGHSLAESSLVPDSVLFTADLPQQMDRVYLAIKYMLSSEKSLLNPSVVEVYPEEKLGVGGFGEVFGGSLLGIPVAVKVSRGAGERIHNDSLRNELRILRRLKHSNIVRFFGACVDVGNMLVALVEERVEGLQLNEFIESVPKLAREALVGIEISCGITSAVRYLHELKPAIIHGDLKPQNIMVSSGMAVKVIDFGLARKVKKSEGWLLGCSIRWSAPKVVHAKSKAVLTKSKMRLDPAIGMDICSLGYIIYLAAAGREPFHNLTSKDILSRAATDTLDWSEAMDWSDRGQLADWAQKLSELCTSSCSITEGREDSQVSARSLLEMMEDYKAELVVATPDDVEPVEESAAWISSLCPIKTGISI